jgi:hypothetical protein
VISSQDGAGVKYLSIRKEKDLVAISPTITEGGEVVEGAKDAADGSLVEEVWRI